MSDEGHPWSRGVRASGIEREREREREILFRMYGYGGGPGA